jgi:hypothetical protein
MDSAHTPTLVDLGAALLSDRLPDGTIPLHPYAKWRGAHWVLVLLAEVDHPTGDESLVPLREQELGWLLSDEHASQWPLMLRGRPRLHASLEGNAIWALLTLGLDDERLDPLARRLVDAQWPDGGWNCDRHVDAHVSSVEETLIPFRGLSLYARVRGDDAVRAVAERAAEFLLDRHLYRRLRDGRPMRDRFLKLAFPPYWHYDILFGLKAMAEAGLISDERCAEPLDLLEAKRLPDGGFPAERRHYRGPAGPSGASNVDWGGTSVRRSNPWVTRDAEAVLAAAGRLPR